MPNSAGVEVGRISVKVSPNTKEFRKELKGELEEIEKALKAKIHVEPDMDGFREKVNAETKGLKTKVKVEPDRNNLRDVEKSLAGLGKGGNGGFLGGIADGLGNIRAFGIGLSGILGILLLLPAAISLISGALLTLPAIAAGLLVPIGAIALGLDGIKEAAKTLQAPFDSLKKTMSGVFQTQLTPVFEKLKTIFPVLEQSMPRVASALSNMANSLVSAVTSAPGMALIQSTIDNIATGLNNSAPAVGSFTNGLLKLTDSVATKFPGVGESLSRIGDQFSGWIDKITAKDPSTGVSQLDTALKSLKDTLAPLGGTIGDLLRKGFEKLNDPVFVAGMKEVTEDLRQIANFSFDKLASGFSETAGYIKDIKDFWNSIPQGFKDFLIGKQEQKIATNRPLLPGQREQQQKTQDTAKSGSVFDSQAINETKNSMGLLVSTIEGKFIELWAKIKLGAASAVTNIVGVFATIGTALSGAWGGIVAAAQGAWNGVVAAVQSAWSNVVSAVQTGISAVVAAVSALPGQITAALGNLGSLLVAAGRAAMDGLLSGIKEGAKAVYTFVSGIASKIASLKGPISYDKTVLVPNGEALMDGLNTGLNNGLQSVLETAKSVAAEIKKAIDSGTDISGSLSGIKPNDLKSYIDAIEEEKKLLKIQKNDLPKTDKAGRAALQNQLDQLQAQKDILSYQKDIDKNNKTDTAAGEDPFAKAAAGLAAAPVNFAKATGSQFLSDIGIGGNGIISKALTEGIKYVFNIGSVDEALSIKDRTDRTQAMASIGPR